MEKLVSECFLIVVVFLIVVFCLVVMWKFRCVFLVVEVVMFFSVWWFVV